MRCWEDKLERGGRNWGRDAGKSHTKAAAVATEEQL